MDKQEILDIMAQKAAEIAKAQAAVVSSITVDELRPLVESQIKLITDPLQAEINSTTSPWVKIRNSVYIKIINGAVEAIISSIQSGLADMSK
jgi:transposase